MDRMAQGVERAAPALQGAQGDAEVPADRQWRVEEEVITEMSMRTFVVRDELAGEPADKTIRARTAKEAAEMYAHDAYYASADKRPDDYELLVTRTDDGKVYEVTVEIRVEFDAFVNPRTEGAEH